MGCKCYDEEMKRKNPFSNERSYQYLNTISLNDSRFDEDNVKSENKSNINKIIVPKITVVIANPLLFLIFIFIYTSEIVSYINYIILQIINQY